MTLRAFGTAVITARYRSYSARCTVATLQEPPLDRHVVDGFFDFLAWSANATSDEIRGLQSGQIQQYTYVFLLGTLALILLLLL